MAETTELRDPWMVAVWPGMGSVALLAGRHLLGQLKPRRLAELDPHAFFEIQAVDVSKGIVKPSPLPRNMIFEWRDPGGRHDLLIFVGETQPPRGGYALCQKLVEFASTLGVKQLFTFAAMATALDLGTAPRTLVASTDRPTLDMVSGSDVEILREGQIGGLNGALLAAAAERGLHGTCLLGEIPYFAASVPCPRAAQAVLERFSELAGIKLQFDELAQQAEQVEKKLRQMVEQEGGTGEESGKWTAEEPYGEFEPPIERPKNQIKPLDEKSRQRIEALFEDASRDRAKALELKQELDRAGVFNRYEDRFLDLFRKAE